MARNVKVIKDPIEPETPEVLAAALVKIGDAFEALSKQGGITNEGLAALVGSMPGMSSVKRADILLVLDNVAKLKSYYVRGAAKK